MFELAKNQATAFTLESEKTSKSNILVVENVES